MKESGLIKFVNCGLCNKAMGANNFRTFNTVTIETYALEFNPATETVEPDKNLANAMHDPLKISVCTDCAKNKNYPVAELWEVAAEIYKHQLEQPRCTEYVTTIDYFMGMEKIERFTEEVDSNELK